MYWWNCGGIPARAPKYCVHFFIKKFQHTFSSKVNQNVSPTVNLAPDRCPLKLTAAPSVKNAFNAITFKTVYAACRID